MDPEDFEWLTLDSTAVKANSRWPVESELLVLLVKRMVKQGNNLERFGLENFHPRNFEKLIANMQKNHVNIAFSVGKPHGVKKRQRYYKAMLKYAQKASDKLQVELQNTLSNKEKIDLQPSVKAKLERFLSWTKDDLNRLQQVMEACRERIFEKTQTPSAEKVLSLSDIDAAMIKKGQRDPILGYKPQLVRTEKGLVSVLIIPLGNASDSGQLDGMIQSHLDRTGILPKQISADDGYAFKAVWDKWTEKGVEIFSIAGAKGKKIIPEEDYTSQAYIEAREQRSAVESLMYTIKYRFDFGTIMRRGISSVRQEMLEKIIAYNFCRKLQLREKSEKENRKQAA